MHYPAELYVRSPRPYHGVGDLRYPVPRPTIPVTRCGRRWLGDGGRIGICEGRRLCPARVGHRAKRAMGAADRAPGTTRVIAWLADIPPAALVVVPLVVLGAYTVFGATGFGSSVIN